MMVCGRGIVTLAAVVPEEIKLPNCRPTLALGSMVAALLRQHHGGDAVGVGWVMVRPSAPPVAR